MPKDKCEVCESLMRSTSYKPAMPDGPGSEDDSTFTCPNDGRKWRQENRHYHYWREMTPRGLLEKVGVLIFG